MNCRDRVTLGTKKETQIGTETTIDIETRTGKVECCSSAEFRALLIRNSVMLLGSASCRPPAAAPRSAKQRRPS
ncbi:hypothetical protein MHYP_G00186300 [Metynnis hypsauchen]